MLIAKEQIRQIISVGRLLKEYRTPLSRYEKFVIFPEIASWQTSIGEVFRYMRI